MRVLGAIGRTLITLGLILLLFVAYQVWGTSFQEGHTQNQLRHQLVQETSNQEIKRALAEATALDKLPKGPPRVAPTVRAPAEGKPVGVIRIPKIGINQVVVQGIAAKDLRKGPGHYISTPLPGEAGNAGIAGHRTTYGHPFYNLDELKKGDPIVVTTDQGIFVYDTVRSEVVSPSDGDVLKNAFGAYLTLTTCNPRFSASTRLVVVAQLAHSQLFPNSGLPAGGPAKSGSNALAGNSNGTVLSVVLWGLVVAVAGGIDLLLARRFRRQRRLIWIGGAIVVLVLLYFFFNAITPLLPASF
jgi:sortase A